MLLYQSTKDCLIYTEFIRNLLVHSSRSQGREGPVSGEDMLAAISLAKGPENEMGFTCKLPCYRGTSSIHDRDFFQGPIISSRPWPHLSISSSWQQNLNPRFGEDTRLSSSLLPLFLSPCLRDCMQSAGQHRLPDYSHPPFTLQMCGLCLSPTTGLFCPNVLKVREYLM